MARKKAWRAAALPPCLSKTRSCQCRKTWSSSSTRWLPRCCSQSGRSRSSRPGSLDSKRKGKRAIRRHSPRRIGTAYTTVRMRAKPLAVRSCQRSPGARKVVYWEPNLPRRGPSGHSMVKPSGPKLVRRACTGAAFSRRPTVRWWVKGTWLTSITFSSRVRASIGRSRKVSCTSQVPSPSSKAGTRGKGTAAASSGSPANTNSRPCPSAVAWRPQLERRGLGLDPASAWGRLAQRPLPSKLQPW